MVGLREGKNREVKNIMASLGLEVNRLIRVSFGPFQLAELAEGELREIKGRMLRDQLGPRLIEEAGANFEAPLLDRREPAEPAPASTRERAPRTPSPVRAPLKEEAGGLVRKFRRDREDPRDRALSRLSTTAPVRGGERRGKREDEKAPEPRKQRAANVWMAPGARPVPREDPDAKTEEKVTRVARKPGDRKAKHEAAAKRARPGRNERAQARDAGGEAERPKREWKPRLEGEDRPKREYRPRTEAGGAERPKREWKPRPEGAERPARDWKARPPRPGRAERSEAAATGEAPVREYRPRPKREGDAERPQREWKPRPPREGAEGADGPKREWKPRPEGAERPKRDFKPRGDGARPYGKPDGERPARSFAGKPRGDRPRGDRPGGDRPGKPFAGKPGGKPGPRKGPPKGPKR
jgi:23S rRNA pseudouridine2605 synthase